MVLWNKCVSEADFWIWRSYSRGQEYAADGKLFADKADRDLKNRDAQTRLWYLERRIIYGRRMT